MATTPPPGPARGANRRQFLVGGAAAIGGAAVAVGGAYAVGAAVTESAPSDMVELNGRRTVPFFGAHQAGIETAAAAHGVFVALDLDPAVDRDRIRAMMRLLTDDAARLTRGDPALADTEPELAAMPAGLTVTFGFGPGFVRRAKGIAPDWLQPLPAFTVDRLEDRFSGGDLLIQVAADEPVTVAHATRMLLKDARAFGTVRWSQSGFRRAHGTASAGTAMRNLFGQVDETVNPRPGSADFADVVWSGEGWMTGGTGVVIRRIRMNLDTWDELDRPGREQVIGRRLSNGAPLTGSGEQDEPDFSAASPLGFPVIPEFSHLRRARSEDPAERIFRRSYNYDEAPRGPGISDSGLIFASYQADVGRQFVPIQRRLDELDLLNQWTTPIGSAVFALPPGCDEGGYVGHTLLG